ncbi:ARF GAP-like zinc finger-containing protein [Histomonas meleagridis]|uniref:ARF GAP-like zinc finger-containing protein n=1 Tax=Histomonas meleagridis TaxID=135588 RepID=UPI00355A1494|nr:ARF GAP-like zinc finger-containing protein [Histomonas meleagridis]KAH0805632.1 ARF GAP-like zinc finger-containing protein [Histomonas meleagridis]
MNENIEFLRLSPLHAYKLQKSVQKILSLKENIKHTKQTFEQYTQVGLSLCDCMNKLAVAFKGYSKYESDPALTSIHDLLINFTETIKDHYNQVNQQIISHLDKFVSEDIEKAVTQGSKAAHEFDNLNKCLDNYFVQAPKKKKSTIDSQEKIMKLIAEFWDAGKSDFELSRQLELVERVTHKQCLGYYDSVKDSFSTLQSALPQSSRAVQLFSENSNKLSVSLQGYYKIYWKRIHQKFPGTTSLEHEGYLFKKGSSGFTKSWQKRYFICKNKQLYYYHDGKDTPQGVLDLLLTTVKPVNDGERKSCFTIISQEKVYTLQALCDYDRDEWIKVIQNNVQYLLEHVGVSDSKAESNNQQIISPSNIPCNKVCCDCGAPNPSWCCINWGTCICIHCSGVHRSLTTTLSKVRSLTLDHLDEQTLKLFEILGNENVNKILEENIGDEKIDQNASKEQREEFIRKKYMEGAFMNKNVEKVDLRSAIKNNDYAKIYLAICQGQLQNQLNGFTDLHYAAAVGDALTTLLVAYNIPVVNVIDDGWSALSYATYYHNEPAAQALLLAGCDPSASQAHPYQIALSAQDEKMAVLFLPYWHGDDEEPEQFTPPNPVN